MEKNKKRFLGILYLIIGLYSLVFAQFYFTQLYFNDNNTQVILSDNLILIIPAFVLSGITFYYGIKFLKLG